MKNTKINVPTFIHGSKLQHVNLEEIQEKQQQQIINDDQTFILQLFSIKQLYQQLQIDKRIILLIQSEELFGYSEELQEIFNLIHFFRIEKGLCFIVDKDKAKNQEKKTNLIQQYIQKSSLLFEQLKYPIPNISIISLTKNNSIKPYLNHFITTPQDLSSVQFDDILIQILSRDKKQLEVKILKGILFKNGRYYFENQTEQNKPIFVESIEDELLVINQFSQQKTFKIVISDDSEYKNQSFLSNRPFSLQKQNENNIIETFFDTEDKFNQFNMNYRMAHELYKIVLEKSEYEIEKLEYCCSQNFVGLKIFTLQIKNNQQIFVSNLKNEKNIEMNGTFIILDKQTNEIILYGQTLQSNYQLTLPPKNVNQISPIQFENFFIPIQEKDVIDKIERGQLQQKGSQILKCRVCFEQSANSILIPCGHIRYCFDCCLDLKECLFCDTLIEKKKKLIIQTFDPQVDEQIQNLPVRYHEFMQHSVKNNTNIEFALLVELQSKLLKLNQYYCQICQSKKAQNITFCEKDHIVNNCSECNKQIRECCIKDCNAKIILKKQIVYKFDE